MTTIYGIPTDEDYCHENKLKTILPVSAIKYALDNKHKLPYIEYDQETNQFTTKTITDIILKLNGDLKTEHIVSDGICMNFPPHDIVIDKNDYESKICVFPCHNKTKIFEMIIRQNNIACCIQNIVNSNPDIKHISDNFKQQPYILLNLYDNNGLKPIILSNKALIYMCLNSSLNSKSKRADIVCEKINSMIEEYSKTKIITYKKNKSDTVPHQKITLFPMDYIPTLKETIDNIHYIKYSDIISGDVCKTRNICDYINEYQTNKKINELEEEIKRLKLE